VVGVEGLNARALTPSPLQQACEVALSEVIEDEEDNETQPEAPYSWMRNGGLVDEEYDDSDDAKDRTSKPSRPSARQGQGRASRARLPVVRRRRAECAGCGHHAGV
jgi:23S rRNA (cytidine1920-2'-O)/16S rRNA (cytidine1409-2'-O)-methyltransferase